MIYWLFEHFSDQISFLNLLGYITFRAAFAAVTSLAVALLLGPWVIRKLSNIQYVETIDNHQDQLFDKHKHKQNTPTMGGLLILMALFLSVFLWCDLSNFYVQIALMTIVWLGFVGYLDDYLKCVRKRKGGLSKTWKLAHQLLFTIFVGGAVYISDPLNNVLFLPFFKSAMLPLGLAYLVLIFFVIIGTSNAVNITDGLDGLAAGCLLMAAMSFAVICYITGHYGFSSYLNLPFINGTGELAIVCTAMVGSCLGFLWFNAHPAEVFMGDTGSLALGGLLGMIAVMIKQELLLFVVGGVFVIETLSVIIQIVYFRKTGKRFFLVAPLHHHFELKGLAESKIVTRFWILAAIFAVMSLGTLKIR